MIDYDFTEKIFTYHYYEWLNVLSEIGGLAALIGPAFAVLVPIFTMLFLKELALIIITK